MHLAFAIASAGLLALYGCGGGSDGGSSGGGGGDGGGSGGITSIIVQGIAAKGAAFVGATITVADSTGDTVGTSGAPVGADGLYTVTLSAGAVAPFVVTASRDGANGEVESLVSVVPEVSGNTATANITPVTHLIASRLATSGDPLKLATELANKVAVLDAATVESKVQEVQEILDPILQATETTGANPLTGEFAVDGSGYDRLLDSIAITIIPASATKVNIEVAVKQQLPEGEAPNAIQFTNEDAVASITPLSTIAANTLVEPGTAVLIAEHLAQLNACFAVPLSERVTPGGTTAADILASDCLAVFSENNPALFKSNGSVVGKGKAFSGIFVEGGTGVVFSRGAYEFTRANTEKDIVVSYTSKTAAGDETQDVFVLRKDADGKLRQIGNQYAYPGRVAAYQQYRRFLTLDQSPFDYYSTGYNLNVPHVTGGSGVDGSIFERVVVTSPRGNTLTLVPRVGYNYLVLVKPGPVLTGTSFVRLRGEYADTSNADDPAAKDTSLFFADRTEFTNEHIATIPAQAVWKFDYFVAGNTGDVPDATQYYKTRARALTIPELKEKGFAELSPALIDKIQADADPSTGVVPIGDATTLDLDYAVPAGALPPTSLQVWGRYSGGGFTDSTSVGSTERAASISCSPSGSADLHCSAGAGSPYVSDAYLVGAHLWARDLGGREYASYFATYKLP
jgi:hypothetical protein